MTIKELEQRSGLERTAIRFYEKEGFIHPIRMDNGYRNYSEDDLELLLRIKLLRSLHISLETIHELQNGTSHLNSILAKQMKQLEDEKTNITYAQNLCKMIQNENTTFATLDAQKYLDQISQMGISSYFQATQEDARLYEDESCHPWKRYFARMLDLFVYGAITCAILTMVFHMNILHNDPVHKFLQRALPLVLMAVLEPLSLMLFGTTPGKFIFGFYIVHKDGSRLTYHEGFQRTCCVLLFGLGLQIPIASIYTLIRSYRRCVNEEAQPWDTYSVKFSARLCSFWRWILIPIILVGYVGTFVITFLLQMLPPNHGDLTLEQFAENYNYYAKFYNVTSYNGSLNEDGKWTPPSHSGTTTTTDPLSAPIYEYTMEGDYITSVSFSRSLIGPNDSWIYLDSQHALLITMSLYGAHSSISEFFQFYDTVLQATNNSSWKPTQLNVNGLLIENDVTYSGYLRTDYILVPEDNVKEQSYQQTFSIIKK